VIERAQPRAVMALVALLASWSGASLGASGTPVEIVGDKIDALQQLVDQHGDDYRRDPEQLYEVIDRVVVPAFNLDVISEAVTGKGWRSATRDERDRFKAAFKRRLIVFYGAALLERAQRNQSGWKLSEIDALEGTARVRAQLPQKVGPPVSLQFDLRLDDDRRWLVCDMSVEGLGLVQNFRAQFGPVVKRDGLAALTSRLETGAIPADTWKPPERR